MDTPAKIAILGAGPIGIEAGLYARYLGYDVILLEQRRVASHVHRWGHQRMTTPFSQSRSPLGLAALQAQDPAFQAPDDHAILTGHQWIEQYLLPLSQTDLLHDHIDQGARVRAVGRSAWLKGQRPLDAERHEDGFRILVEQPDGSERIERADIVIDATGVAGQPNWCGSGGIPARGERLLRSKIEYHIPDIRGAERAKYENRRVLVVGDGHCAARTILALSHLADQTPRTHVTWVAHRPADLHQELDKEECENPSPAEIDCPDHQEWTARALECTLRPNTHIAYHPDWSVDAMQWEAGEQDGGGQRFLIWFAGHDQPEAFDQVVANVGFRPDHSIHEELHVQLCPFTAASIEMSDRRPDPSFPDRDGPDLRKRPNRLITREPHFYLLGAKSHGRDPCFRFSIGLEQIRDLFTVIGDRSTLDLYATARYR